MAEVLPFECEHEAECHESGWDYSKDCPERCTLRERKRVRELENTLICMRSYVVSHNTPNWPGVDMTVFDERLEELGVRVDD